MGGWIKGEEFLPLSHCRGIKRKIHLSLERKQLTPCLSVEKVYVFCFFFFVRASFFYLYTLHPISWPDLWAWDLKNNSVNCIPVRRERMQLVEKIFYPHTHTHTYTKVIYTYYIFIRSKTKILLMFVMPGTAQCWISLYPFRAFLIFF